MAKLQIQDLIPGKTYKVQVRAINANGEYSEWSTTQTIAIPSKAGEVSLTNNYITNLNGAGKFNAGGMSFGLDVNGTSDGIYLDTNNYWYTTGAFSVGNGTSGITWNPGTSVLNVSGTINATLGTIAGWNITPTELYSGSGSTKVALNTSGYLDSPKLYIGSGNHGSSDTAFYASKNGAFSLSNQLIFNPANGTAGADDFADLTVVGKIRGAIENVTQIPSNKLQVSITGVNITSSTAATITTATHAFLTNEYITVEGLTGNAAAANGTYQITVPAGSNTTFTIVISGGTVSNTTGITGATATIRELTLGLHPAESGYHDAGIGIRLDKYNWWFTNNQFRVGTTNSYVKWDGTTLETSGTIKALAGAFGPSTDNQWIIGTSEPTIYFTSSNTTNLAIPYDYSFENDSPYWYSKMTTTSDVFPVISISTGVKKHGSQSKSLGYYSLVSGGTVSNPSSTMYKTVSNSDPTTNVRFSLADLGITPGNNVAFSIYIYMTSSGTATAQVKAFTGSTPGASPTPRVSGTTGTTTSTLSWQKLTSYLTTVAGDYLEFSISTTQSLSPSSYSGGNLLYIDVVQIESGSGKTTTNLSYDTANLAFYLRSSQTATYMIEMSNPTTSELLFGVTPTGAMSAVSGTMSKLRLTGTGDVSLSSTSHPFQIGSDTANNLRIDINEIQSVNNGAAVGLSINPSGGNVTLGNSSSLINLRGQSIALDGANTTPSYSFTNSTNSGMYYTGTALGFSYGGSTSMTISGSTVAIINSTNLTVAGNITATGDVTANSQVLISSPANTSYALEVGGSARIDSNLVVTGTTSMNFGSVYSYSMFSDVVSSSGGERSVYVAASDLGYMVGNIASTRRVKQQIAPAENEILSSRFLELEAVKFKYNAAVEKLGDSAKYYYGFIAEDAEELGLEFLYGVDDEGIPDYFAHERMPVYLFAHIKSQHKKIEALEERLAALENK